MAFAPTTARPFDSPAGSPAEPPSATGQYPDPVWADEASTSPAGMALEDGGDDAAAPLSATGQYPGPVWADERPNGVSASTTMAAEGGAATAPPLGLKEVETAEEAAGEPAPPGPPPTELTNEEAYRIIRVVAEGHSGDQLYSAVSPDLEYTTPGSAAFGRRHFGLGFGLVLFSQSSGQLGRVLELTRARNPAAFGEAFGPHDDELLAVTTAPTEDARLAPVGGELLWAPAWLDRFRLAGARAECQAAQNETAIEDQFRPMARIAVGLGLDTDRGLAMAYDIVVARGLDAGLRWLVTAAGPIQGGAQRDAALRWLGHADLAAFQAATGLPSTAGRPDPATHGALVTALRAAGAPMPTASDLACRAIQASRGAARARLERINASDAFSDIAHSIARAATPGG